MATVWAVLTNSDTETMLIKYLPFTGTQKSALKNWSGHLRIDISVYCVLVKRKQMCPDSPNFATWMSLNAEKTVEKKKNT